MSQLLEVLQAMDRLNSWVRSPGFRRGFSGAGVRRHVYALKRGAIERAQRELTCVHRPLSTLVTCRDCGGSGRYTDWDGHTWPHCRACASKGIVALPFVQTDLFPAEPHCTPPLFTWHSPQDRFPLDSSLLGVEISRGEWEVNQPGRDMAIDDAARDLLLLDAAFPRNRGYCVDRCDCERHYALFLGGVEDRCAHCGAAVTQDAADKRRGGMNVGRVEFTFVCCEACYARVGATAKFFEVGLPLDLLTPNVRAWWEGHGNEMCEEDRAV